LKRKIIFLIFLFAITFSAYAQSVLGLPSEARSGLKAETQRRIDLLRMDSIFSTKETLDRDWFDGAMFKILTYFDNFYLYFILKVKVIAMICLALSLGIGCIKLMFGGTEVSKFFVQIFLSVMTCMILLAFFPKIMKGILRVTSELAYGAALYMPFENIFDTADKEAKFKAYIVNIASPDYVKARYVLTVDTGGEVWVPIPDDDAEADKKVEELMRKTVKTLDADILKEWEQYKIDELGYEAAQRGDQPYTSEAEFYNERLNRSGTELLAYGKVEKNNQMSSLVRGAKDVKQILALQVIDEQTGVISINKIGKISLITLKGLFGTVLDFKLPKRWILLMLHPATNIYGLVMFLQLIPYIFVVLVIGLMYLYSMFMGVINYIMCLVQFGFLYGLGILFIPLMLWDGTKTMFEKMVGSMMNICVHLLVKTLVIFMTLLLNLELLKEMFLNNNLRNLIKNGRTSSNIFESLEFYLSAAFVVLFIKIINDQSTAFAEFLCGGSPRLAFGEFAQSARSLGTAANTSAGITKAAAGTATGAVMAYNGAVLGAAGAGVGAGMSGGGLTGGLANFGRSLGNSGLKSVNGLLGKGVNAVKGGGQTMKTAFNDFAAGVSGSGSSGGGRSGGSHGEQKESKVNQEHLNSADSSKRQSANFMQGVEESKKRQQANGQSTDGFTSQIKQLLSGINGWTAGEARTGGDGPIYNTVSEDQLPPQGGPPQAGGNTLLRSAV